MLPNSSTSQTVLNTNLQSPIFKDQHFDVFEMVAIDNPLSEKGGYQCPVCLKTFVQSGTLNRHVKIHVGGPTYDCLVCGKRYGRHDNLLRHVRLIHDLSETITESN